MYAVAPTGGRGRGAGGGGDARRACSRRQRQAQTATIVAPALVHTAEVVQVSLEELEERSGEVVEMRKRLEDMKSEPSARSTARTSSGRASSSA